MCFFIACFGVVFNDVSPYVCIICLFFNSVQVTDKLPSRLTLYSPCIMSIFDSSYFPFCFEGGIWVLIAPVPVHCLLVARREYMNRYGRENSKGGI